jgi:hypothetical protein
MDENPHNICQLLYIIKYQYIIKKFIGFYLYISEQLVFNTGHIMETQPRNGLISITVGATHGYRDVALRAY